MDDELLTVYGFGSFFKGKSAFDDIDVLLVHKDTSKNSCLFAIYCKKKLLEFDLRMHITMLSEKEEVSNSFISKSSAKIISIISGNTKNNDIAATRVLIYQMIGERSMSEKL